MPPISPKGYLTSLLDREAEALDAPEMISLELWPSLLAFTTQGV
jgi:hypothetical protein